MTKGHTTTKLLSLLPAVLQSKKVFTSPRGPRVAHPSTRALLSPKHSHLPHIHTMRPISTIVMGVSLQEKMSTPMATLLYCCQQLRSIARPGLSKPRPRIIYLNLKPRQLCLAIDINSDDEESSCGDITWSNYPLKLLIAALAHHRLYFHNGTNAIIALNCSVDPLAALGTQNHGMAHYRPVRTAS